MEKKPIQELATIYAQHDTKEWSEDAFEAIRQIFQGRNIPLPKADSNTYHQPPPKTEPKKHHQPPPSTEPVSDQLFHARVLGLRGQVTFADIKRHYRERMMEYHPDKVAALGPKLRELAEEETKKINAAYEFFANKYASNRNA